eukprot:7811894-Karenia_brevis.AAC.1
MGVNAEAGSSDCMLLASKSSKAFTSTSSEGTGGMGCWHLNLTSLSFTCECDATLIDDDEFAGCAGFAGTSTEGDGERDGTLMGSDGEGADANVVGCTLLGGGPVNALANEGARRVGGGDTRATLLNA